MWAPVLASLADMKSSPCHRTIHPSRFVRNSTYSGTTLTNKNDTPKIKFRVNTSIISRNMCYRLDRSTLKKIKNQHISVCYLVWMRSWVSHFESKITGANLGLDRVINAIIWRGASGIKPRGLGWVGLGWATDRGSGERQKIYRWNVRQT
jgi:hypothetical protein